MIVLHFAAGCCCCWVLHGCQCLCRALPPPPPLLLLPLLLLLLLPRPLLPGGLWGKLHAKCGAGAGTP